MSSNSEHALDWDSRRETLSAFLDGRLSAEDETALRGHIAACASCSRELAELRQVVTLLHALPRPLAPRSFALPVAAPAPLAPTPLSAAGAGSARHPARWPRVAQWAGGLVAAAGLIVGVAGAFGTSNPAAVHLAGSAPSVYAPAATGRAAQNGADSNADRAATATHQAMFGAVPSGTVASGAAPSGSVASGTVAATPTPAAVDMPKTPVGFEPAIPEAPVIGTTLLLVGAAAFAVGTGSRRRLR